MVSKSPRGSNILCPVTTEALTIRRMEKSVLVQCLWFPSVGSGGAEGGSHVGTLGTSWKHGESGRDTNEGNWNDYQRDPRFWWENQQRAAHQPWRRRATLGDGGARDFRLRNDSRRTEQSRDYTCWVYPGAPVLSRSKLLSMAWTPTFLIELLVLHRNIFFFETQNDDNN